MADTVTIYANVDDGATVNGGTSEGVTVTTSVVEGITVSGNVVTGAKGDNGREIEIRRDNANIELSLIHI